MKKFLLVTCAFAACMGASAQQHLQKAPVANHALKLCELNAVQFNGVAKKAPAKKVDTKSFIGIFVIMPGTRRRRSTSLPLIRCTPPMYRIRMAIRST